jgi:hypothetical protein
MKKFEAMVTDRQGLIGIGTIGLVGQEMSAPPEK